MFGEVAVCEAGEEVAQICVGLNAVHFTSADQAGKPGPISAPFVVPGKERIAAVHGRSADRVFHEVGVNRLGMLTPCRRPILALTHF